jgi:putative oxidoreductase
METAMADKTTIDEIYAPYGAFLLRVALGLMWIAHAGLKYFAFGMDGFAQFLASQGLPSFMAWPVVLLEVGGGLAILLGVYARQAALALTPVMAVAMWTHLPNGWVFNAQGGGWEYPAFLLVTSVALLLVGDGAFAFKRGNLAFTGSAGKHPALAA